MSKRLKVGEVIGGGWEGVKDMQWRREKGKMKGQSE